MKTIGARAKEIRESKKMTLQQVSPASGYDAGNLSKLEKGKINWSGPAIHAIAKALGVPPRDFFLTPAEILVLKLWETLGEAERSLLCRLAGVAEIKTPSAGEGKTKYLGDHAPRLSARYAPGLPQESPHELQNSKSLRPSTNDQAVARAAERDRERRY